MSLYLYENKLLVNDGKLAAHEDCCCDDDSPVVGDLCYLCLDDTFPGEIEVSIAGVTGSATCQSFNSSFVLRQCSLPGNPCYDYPLQDMYQRCGFIYILPGEPVSPYICLNIQRSTVDGLMLTAHVKIWCNVGGYWEQASIDYRKILIPQDEYDGPVNCCNLLEGAVLPVYPPGTGGACGCGGNTTMTIESLF